MIRDIYRNTAPSTERFQQAKNAVEERYRSDWISTRHIAQHVAQWHRLGFSVDPRRDRFDRLLELEPDDLAAVFTELKNAPMVVVMAGPLADLDRERLAALGDIVTIELDDVASYGAAQK